MSSSKKNFVRIQFEIPQEKVDELDHFREEVDMTRTQVFKLALSLFLWAAGEIRRGRRIASVGEDGDALGVFIPGLD